MLVSVIFSGLLLSSSTSWEGRRFMFLDERPEVSHHNCPFVMVYHHAYEGGLQKYKLRMIHHHSSLPWYMRIRHNLKHWMRKTERLQDMKFCYPVTPEARQNFDESPVLHFSQDNNTHSIVLQNPEKSHIMELEMNNHSHDMILTIKNLENKTQCTWTTTKPKTDYIKLWPADVLE